MPAPASMPSVMVDAMVVIYAVAVERGVVGEGHPDWQVFKNSHHLFHSIDRIAMASIAWHQIRRSTDSTLGQIVEKWSSRIFVVAMGQHAADRATELYRKVHGSPDVCQRCFGIKPPEPCSVCHAQRSKQKATDDILIAATADVSYHISTLYSEDGGVLHLNQYCPNVEIIRPPRPPAEPIPLPFPTPIEDALKPKHDR